MKKINLLNSIVLVLLILATCAIFPPDNTLNNTIFPNANLIEVGVPAMNAVVNTTPSFSWNNTGKKAVFIAIFTNNIIVQQDPPTIVNVNDIIWAWNTGLDTGREGSIFYNDGVDVLDGVLQTGSPPTPLTIGSSYVWAVWAWDDSGYKIVAASKEMFFTVQ